MGGINGIFDYNLSQQQVIKPVEKVDETVPAFVRTNKPTFQELLDGYRNPKKEEPEEEEKKVVENNDRNVLAMSYSMLDYVISTFKKKEDEKKK